MQWNVVRQTQFGERAGARCLVCVQDGLNAIARLTFEDWQAFKADLVPGGTGWKKLYIPNADSPVLAQLKRDAFVVREPEQGGGALSSKLLSVCVCDCVLASHWPLKTLQRALSIRAEVGTCIVCGRVKSFGHVQSLERA